jgi:hypothetical protein
MRKYAIAMVACVAAASSAPVALATQGEQPDQHGTRTSVVRLIDTDQRVAVHDATGDRNLDFGDIVVFRTIDTWHGHRVGHGVGQVTLLGRHDAFLVATLVLRDGQIDIQGDYPGITVGTHGPLAVTGGTGRYANGHGVAYARQIGNGRTLFRIVVRR